jgi:hypothetical protein
MTGFRKFDATRYEVESGARVRLKETHRMHKFGEGYIPQRSYDLLNEPENHAIEIFEELGVALGIDRGELNELLAAREVEAE